MHECKIRGGNCQQPGRNPIIETPETYVLSGSRRVRRVRRFRERLDSALRRDCFIDLKNLDVEAVAISRERFNPFATFRSQDLSQGRHLESQVGVFDKSIGPQGVHQFLFGQDAPSALHEKDEKIEGLRLKR